MTALEKLRKLASVLAGSTPESFPSSAGARMAGEAILEALAEAEREIAAAERGRCAEIARKHSAWGEEIADLILEPPP